MRESSLPVFLLMRKEGFREQFERWSAGTRGGPWGDILRSEMYYALPRTAAEWKKRKMYGVERE